MRSTALPHGLLPATELDSPPAAPFEPATPVIDLQKGAAARKLFKLEQLEVNWDEQNGALWTFMRPRGRPSYNPDFLDDFHAWQRGIVAQIGRASCRERG